MACRTLVPQPGIEPVPPAVEARSLNHWTAREVPYSAYQIVSLACVSLIVKVHKGKDHLFLLIVLRAQGLARSTCLVKYF